MWRSIFDPEHHLGRTRRGKLVEACPRFAWLDICQMAAWEEGAQMGVWVQRGELHVSTRWLAERWGWSKSKADRFIAYLIEQEQLEVRHLYGKEPEKDSPPRGGTPQGSIYALVNYEAYAVGVQRAGTPTEKEPETEPGTSIKGEEEKKRRRTRARTQKVSHDSLPKTPVPEDFEPTEKHVAKADELGLDLDDELEQFVEYYQAHGSLRASWNASFSTWLRMAVKYRAEGRTEGSPDPRGGGEFWDHEGPAA